jgi:phage-related protein
VDGLFEVRSSITKREFRILFCIIDGVFVALHGLQKKTRKVPPADITIARARKKEIEQ